MASNANHVWNITSNNNCAWEQSKLHVKSSEIVYMGMVNFSFIMHDKCNCGNVLSDNML